MEFCSPKVFGNDITFRFADTGNRRVDAVGREVQAVQAGRNHIILPVVAEEIAEETKRDSITLKNVTFCYMAGHRNVMMRKLNYKIW